MATRLTLTYVLLWFGLRLVSTAGRLLPASSPVGVYLRASTRGNVLTSRRLADWVRLAAHEADR